MPRRRLAALVVCLLANALVAQNGDKKGEAQPGLPEDLVVPPAPVLTPDLALAAFRIQPGYRIEIAAADPLVNDPVCLAFDPDGRMWVVEMLGFMPDADGSGELNPVGKIAVLSDTDGDGRADERTDFLDKLVLPRALALYQGGVLLIEPPKLWFCRDTNGDGRCDKREVVLDTGFEAGTTNPEHAGNALTLGLDNWIYIANFDKRVRLTAKGWRVERAHRAGQWGMSQDDWGRRYYNYNSTYLYADLYPSHYGVRNRALGSARGINVRLDADQSTWPIRITPGINRGYQKPMLRDFKLARFTATCGPCVYRGDAMPELSGDVFVPEPAGNLVRRAVVEDTGITLSAHNAYDKAEFLASMDERFRPVNCYNGPDGALYVVDLYRGILQHRVFMTTFLRRQVEDRGLDKPVGLGRIWRIVPEHRRLRRARPLSGLASSELAGLLAHANGWTRATAQRLLIERGDQSVVPQLRELAAAGLDPRTRIHALWALEGLGKLADDDVRRAFDDSDARVRAQAVRLGEHMPVETLARLAADASPLVRLQLILSLGEHQSDAASALLTDLLVKEGADPLMRSAALSGIGGHELAFLGRLLAKHDATSAAKASLQDLAKLLARQRRAPVLERVLGAVARGVPLWQQRAVVAGLVRGLPGGRARKGAFRFAKQPEAFAALSKVEALKQPLAKLREALYWPGLGAPIAKAAPLTKSQKRLFKIGKHYFGATCAQCHQPHGRGQDGLAPSLIDSDMVLGPPGRQVRIVLHGLTGNVTINDKAQDLTMEPLGAKLKDRQIAAVITYTRRSWGHEAEVVSPGEVKRIRELTKGRTKPWTRDELRQIKD